MTRKNQGKEVQVEFFWSVKAEAGYFILFF